MTTLDAIDLRAYGLRERLAELDQLREMLTAGDPAETDAGKDPAPESGAALPLPAPPSAAPQLPSASRKPRVNPYGRTSSMDRLRQVAPLLAAGPMTTAAIAERLGWTAKTVSNVQQEQKKMPGGPYLTRLPDGQGWALTDAGRGLAAQSSTGSN